MTVTKHARDLAAEIADRRVWAQKDEYRRKLEAIQGAFDPPLTGAELSVGLDLDAPESQASTVGRFVSRSPRLARARPDGATRALIDAMLDGELLVAVSRGVPGARRPAPKMTATLEVGVFVVAATAFAWFGDPSGFRLLLGSTVLTLAVLATFLLYFKSANASFAEQSIQAPEVSDELAMWARWHWARTMLAVLALLLAVLGLAQ